MDMTRPFSFSPSKRERSRGTAYVWARSLGWFSIGVGVAQILMPHAMARLAGMPGRAGIMRLYGVREIATGIGLLRARNPAPWAWGRVAGDALDVATLATQHGHRPDAARRAGVAVGVVAGLAAFDVACARKLNENQRRSRDARDYSDRSGWPHGVAAARGVAADDFEVPHDFRIPDAMRPYSLAEQRS
ncbi:MAG TPA: hypothetical protein VFS42_02650 [Burkholderiaceae bacterium]|nr:hypothetical protein [Burkholderiaceae bacterium]